MFTDYLPHENDMRPTSSTCVSLYPSPASHVSLKSTFTLFADPFSKEAATFPDQHSFLIPPSINNTHIFSTNAIYLLYAHNNGCTTFHQYSTRDYLV